MLGGHGTALLQWIIEFYRNAGARHLTVGTGTFGCPLGFSQRQGFRVARIDRNFYQKLSRADRRGWDTAL